MTGEEEALRLVRRQVCAVWRSYRLAIFSTSSRQAPLAAISPLRAAQQRYLHTNSMARGRTSPASTGAVNHPHLYRLSPPPARIVAPMRRNVSSHMYTNQQRRTRSAYPSYYSLPSITALSRHAAGGQACARLPLSVHTAKHSV